MSSISRQECCEAGLRDEGLCEAWPATAKHMARTSYGLLLMAKRYMQILTGCLCPVFEAARGVLIHAAAGARLCGVMTNLVD